MSPSVAENSVLVTLQKNHEEFDKAITYNTGHCCSNINIDRHFKAAFKIHYKESIRDFWWTTWKWERFY